MKILILVRHAKSDWANTSLDDIDRPLNERGKKDAPAMAKRLLDKKIKIDAFVSSPAKRAARTAQLFAEEFGKKKGKIDFIDELYMAAPSAFSAIISKLDKKDEVVALFSHNEGITSFANTLTDVRVDNIPTCGVFAVKADCEKWSDFADAKKEFWFFDYPKAV
jgi:phosphohistidine phosphatase